MSHGKLLLEGEMTRRLPMGQKELIRIKVLEMVRQGKMTLKAAVKTMGVSYRQGIRLYAAYRQEGDAGLIHGNYGKPSNNRTPEITREAALELYRNKYNDFGPTFAAEKFAEEEGLQISVSVLRRLLIEAGEWKDSGMLRNTAAVGSGKNISGSLSNLMVATTAGSRNAAQRAVLSR